MSGACGTGKTCVCDYVCMCMWVCVRACVCEGSLARGFSGCRPQVCFASFVCVLQSSGHVTAERDPSVSRSVSAVFKSDELY